MLIASGPGNDFIEIIGFIAAFCTTVSFVPQIWHLYKTRKADDISLGMYALFCVGVLLWLIYGVIIRSPSLMVANGLTFFFALCILVMKLLWRGGA